RQKLVARLNQADRAQLASDIGSLYYLLAAGQSQQALRAGTTAERMRLLDVALATNRLAECVYAGNAVPRAFALQRSRFERAKVGPQSAQDRTPIEAPSDAFEDRYLLSVELAHCHRW